MVDAGFENQKELTKMQLDNQKEIAEMQNETQKEIDGIQSATSRQNTKDNFFFQAEDGIRDRPSRPGGSHRRGDPRGSGPAGPRATGRVRSEPPCRRRCRG